MVLRRATRQEQTPDVGCEAGRGWGGYLAGGAARGSGETVSVRVLVRTPFRGAHCSGHAGTLDAM